MKKPTDELHELPVSIYDPPLTGSVQAAVENGNWDLLFKVDNLTAAFNPDQERDENGRWGSGGGREQPITKSKLQRTNTDSVPNIIGTAEEREKRWGSTNKEVFESLREQFPEVKFKGESAEIPLNHLTAYAEGLKFTSEQMPNVVESVDIIEFESKDDGIVRGEAIINALGGIEISFYYQNQLEKSVDSPNWSAIQGNSEVLAFGTAVHEMSHIAMAVYTVNYEAKNSNNPELESPTLAPKDYTQKGWAGSYKTYPEFEKANFTLTDPRRTGLDFHPVSEYALTHEKEAFAEGLSNSLVHAADYPNRVNNDPNRAVSQKVFDLLKEGHPITPSLKTALLPVDSVGSSRISQFRVDLQNDSTTKKGLVASASINTDELDSIILVTEFVEGTWLWDFVHAADTLTAAFNPDQPRGADGKWGSSGDTSEPKTGKVDISEIVPGADLSGRDLSGMDLRNVDLTGVNLTGANLRGANLTGADLIGANLYGADLSHAFLKGASLRGANLNSAHLTGADLDGANLKGAGLSGASLQGASLQGADLDDTNLFGANLRDANLTGAHLLDANLHGVILTNADLTAADLTGANLGAANLRDADLSRADLDGANLQGALLDNTDLTGASLQGTDLTGAYLAGAVLSNANLNGANLSSADLTRANLTGANLQEADLRKADLTGADLTDANMYYADLRKADLRNADLSSAHNLSFAKLEGADLTDAKLPPSERENPNGDLLEKAIARADFDPKDAEYFNREIIKKPNERMPIGLLTTQIKGDLDLGNHNVSPKELKIEVETQIESSASFQNLGAGWDSLSSARDYTDEWAITSNDSRKAELIQESASRVLLGQEAPLPTGWDNKYTGQSTQAELVVFEMYQRTQGKLADAGYKPDDTLTLYRGVGRSDTTLSLRPLSSWSAKPAVAAEFASESGTVWAAEVPIKNIVATPATGFGCYDEYEVTVMARSFQSDVGTMLMRKEI
jgi:uncharacterized protein YjbI with pentapeptide repeats